METLFLPAMFGFDLCVLVEQRTIISYLTERSVFLVHKR
jgi:hypothetical protein